MSRATKNKSRAFAEARQLIEDAAKSIEPIDRDQVFEIAYKRTLPRIARNCGGIRPMLWQWWRCRHPVLPKRKSATEADGD